MLRKKIKYFVLKVFHPSVLFYLKKLYYVHALNKFSERDESDIVVVKCLVKPGDYVIDIGANIGWYTKVFSELVGGQGTVYSIEPIPYTFELLSSCIKKLKLKNVKLINCGISEKEESATMQIPQYDNGGENFYRARIINEDKIDHSLRYYKINLKSLDSLFSDLSNKIAFIKCDVEGHELQAVKGATKLLINSKPAWLIEISGNPDRKDSDAFALISIFEKNGYRPWWFNGERLIKRSPGDKSVNYFFLTDYHISIIEASLDGVPVKSS